MLKLDRSCLDVQIYMSSFDRKYFIQVEVYWFQQSTAADSLRRTRPREPKFGWYFSKHFLYKISYRRVITPPVFSFTVNFPRLICHHWTGTGAICQMANEKKEEGISHCSLTLSPDSHGSGIGPQLVPGGHQGFCLLDLGTPRHLLLVQLMVEQEVPKAHPGLISLSLQLLWWSWRDFPNSCMCRFSRVHKSSHVW